jgi:hypothetical protein
MSVSLASLWNREARQSDSLHPIINLRGAAMSNGNARRFRAALGVSLSLTVMIFLASCGADSGKPALGKVHGTVTYKGKPVDGGHIVFTPAAGKSGGGGGTEQTATGEISSDGTYEMTTFNTGDGAILGQHIVTVRVLEKGSENLGKPDATSRISYVIPKAVTPSKYASPETSPLRCTVVEGTNKFDIDLKD